MTGPLVLAGCGKMGKALLDGWIACGVAASAIIVVEPDPKIAEGLKKHYGAAVFASPDEIKASVQPEVIVLAVKPQVMDGVAKAYARFAAYDSVFLSIAAGKTIAYFAAKLGPQAPIVRSMPNTPASVRQGITVACQNRQVSPSQRQRCHDLLAAVGEVAWIEEESLMDAVTAVSGSGPAYVFLLTECLAKAGRQAGLPDDLAMRLAKATVSGAGELMRQSPISPEALRNNVTSPGGTTAKALEVLLASDGLQSLLTKAVAAAASRARELAS